MWLRNFRCCCKKSIICAIYSDSFAIDALTSDWDTISGSWSVGSGVLTTGSSSGLLVAKSLHPNGNQAAYIAAKMRCSTTGTAGRLVGNYQNSSNYWYAEIQPGGVNGTLKIFQVAGGSATQIGTTTTVPSLNANDLCDVNLCFYNGRVTAMAQAGGGLATLSADATITGDRAGVGSGSVGGTVEIEDFSFERHQELSPKCKACLYCDVCIDGDEPYRMQVDLEGDLFDATECDCSQFIGSYILERYNSCDWRYYFPGKPCDMVYLQLLFLPPPPGFISGSIVVNLVVNDGTTGGTDVFWRLATTVTPFNCKNLNRLAIPGVISGGVAARCLNAFSASCYVTSLVA